MKNYTPQCWDRMGSHGDSPVHKPEKGHRRTRANCQGEVRGDSWRTRANCDRGEQFFSLKSSGRPRVRFALFARVRRPCSPTVYPGDLRQTATLSVAWLRPCSPRSRDHGRTRVRRSTCKMFKILSYSFYLSLSCYLLIWTKYRSIMYCRGKLRFQTSLVNCSKYFERLCEIERDKW